MKHLFAIAVFFVAACGLAVGDVSSDERELTQLVNDLNAAIVKPDIAFLERVLAKDYVHYRPHGNVETRAQVPWRIAKAGAWISIRSSRMKSKSASTGIRHRELSFHRQRKGPGWRDR